ncbi:MAG: PTS lactose/cellobiose transporter subunit IIA [Hespellia sp.]|jgi:PTS system cellobiose-specific IIA component|nr:PTS lactose/cellobiose transporter subunit IIA [Hespellia sp.]
MGELVELKSMDSENLEELLMLLITNGGGAKASYIDAIQCAREGNYEQARELCDTGTKMYEEAHSIHFAMIGREDLCPQTQMERMLLIHAEDQLNSAETFKILAEEFIELYKKLDR